MSFKLEFSLKSDIGKQRTKNQDVCVAVPEVPLFLISDGMGGPPGGEIASAISAKIISQKMQQAKKNNLLQPHVLKESMEAANRAIFQASLQNPSLQGMGTTSTSLLFKNYTLWIGHIGDSRCYYLHHGKIWQLTQDHSLAQEKFQAGFIQRSELKTDSTKNILTRALGFDQKVEIELYEMEISSQDCFLVCSDGLWSMIEDEQILKIVEQTFFKGKQIQSAVNQLIQAANDHGGQDNISVILIQVK